MTTTSTSPTPRRTSRFAGFTARMAPKHVSGQLFVAYWMVSVAVIVGVAILIGAVFMAGDPTKASYTYSAKLYVTLIIATLVLMVVPVIVIIRNKTWKQLVSLLIVLAVLVFTWQFLVFVFAGSRAPGWAVIIGGIGLLALPVLVYFAGFQRRRHDDKLVQLQASVIKAEQVRDRHHRESEAAEQALATATKNHKKARKSADGLGDDARVVGDKKSAAQKAHDIFLKSDTTVPPLAREVERLRKRQARLDAAVIGKQKLLDDYAGDQDTDEYKALEADWKTAGNKADAHRINDLQPAEHKLTDAEDALAASATAQELNRLTDEETRVQSRLKAAQADADAKKDAKKAASTRATNAASTLKQSNEKLDKAVAAHKDATARHATGTVGYYLLIAGGSLLVFAFMTAFVAMVRVLP